MNLEEKIERLRQSSMEEARQAGNKIIQEQTESLNKIYDDYCKDASRKAELDISVARNRTRQEINRSVAGMQTELTGKEGALQVTLKDKLFSDVRVLLADYMKTPAYRQLLEQDIDEMLAFAEGEEITLYLSPGDAALKDTLEASKSAPLTVSAEDFAGGMRGVLKERNILIDYSFQTALEEEYKNFLFTGGDKS